MATTPEGQLKFKIKEFLKSLGTDCWYFMPVPTGYGRKGIPDFIGCYKGRFFAVETKAPGKKPTAWQKHELSDIDEARGYIITADNFETFSLRFCAIKNHIDGVVT